MDIDELKRKLRDLKKYELSTRFGGSPPAQKGRLVWDRFFSTRDEYDSKVRYSLYTLSRMDKQKIKEVFEEFFYQVYFEKYRENGIIYNDIFDPQLLTVLGLHAGAGLDEIKKKFRELAKKYHPDHGGDSDKMIKLLEAYEKLMGK